MSALGIARRWLDLARAGRLDAEQLRRLQNAKLQALVAHAYATVPFYRRHFDAAGIRPADLRTVDDLAHLPVLTRAELQAQPPETLLSSAYRPETLEFVRTTGSTGRPLDVRRDPAFRQTRSALFLRALAAGGQWPGHKLLILAGMRRGEAAGWMRWHYHWRDADPAELLIALERVRPAALYGPVTSVRRLTEAVAASRTAAWRPRRVFTTAESLDAATRQRITATLGAAVFEIYGSTELGTVAWECGTHAGLHLAEETTIVELLPETPDGACRIVATSLDMRAMPLLRYETGDLARPTEGACACGSRLRRIARVEGRLVDCVRRRDGRLLSPYLFTERLEDIPGIERYQLVQEDLERFRLRVLGHEAEGPAIQAAASSVVRDLVGPEATLAIVFEPSLDPPQGRKFRVVECRVGTPEARP